MHTLESVELELWATRSIYVWLPVEILGYWSTFEKLCSSPSNIQQVWRRFENRWHKLSRISSMVPTPKRLFRSDLVSFPMPSSIHDWLELYLASLRKSSQNPNWAKVLVHVPWKKSWIFVYIQAKESETPFILTRFSTKQVPKKKSWILVYIQTI